MNIKQYYNSNQFNSGYKFGVEAKRNENKQIIKFEQIILRKLDNIDKVRAPLELGLHEK
ncbi:hypothetical protein [Tenacibaculum finnmarkense]|uniref:Uncharacterized protein n=1 Tax=Tenacibaculum finnmarkense genomovar finnmarkense TaxID=1458503 RepID=A0AAP1RGV2_9FLAO|nr:hypothetical protein [Tenacibaculum finnmarkense]MBE7653358.1 hypothetical protein [Tenacibaculum finnmarkense genomovar finnmarkense]MBE7695658.1 hypothetical protein [Tenacibaculum finnmarkense genomovar finnmarkense]MCD8427681.1 hypothetical protein [Tenacibaculum finnmarkense genomovar finnmarkense]MCG8731452.1 hypothetical protein [Tenacibaculum finnmarkense]MCG8751649.1 hypothetical protein [Tenacibaculum finnmarkense]